MQLFSSKQHDSSVDNSGGTANQKRPSLTMNHTESPARRFSLGIISLRERWSIQNFRRSSLISTASPDVSLLQGANEHEEGESRRSKRITPPSSLRNQFRKFYNSSATTFSTNSIQTHSDEGRSDRSSSGLSSFTENKVSPVHANWQPEFPDEPIHIDCPNCHLQVESVTTRINGCLVWISSFILLLSTLVLACVPCCLPWLKDVQHNCPKCNTVLGRYRRW
jgi:hypothetical protein